MNEPHIPENAPSDLYITEALDRRPPRQADYVRESKLIQALAVRMIDEPETVLPKFVELAMAVTGASSAGLSLLEPEPAPGVFRWRHLHGTLAPFEGATTPRNHSPCGITLDRNRPVLTRMPQRAYGWIADAGVSIGEVLLVPLYRDGPEPFGTLWVVSEKEDFFTRDQAAVLEDVAAGVGGALAYAERGRAPVA